jgi:hypothetical protein
MASNCVYIYCFSCTECIINNIISNKIYSMLHCKNSHTNLVL